MRRRAFLAALLYPLAARAMNAVPGLPADARTVEVEAALEPLPFCAWEDETPAGEVRFEGGAWAEADDRVVLVTWRCSYNAAGRLLRVVREARGA